MPRYSHAMHSQPIFGSNCDIVDVHLHYNHCIQVKESRISQDGPATACSRYLPRIQSQSGHLTEVLAEIEGIKTDVR